MKTIKYITAALCLSGCMQATQPQTPVTVAQMSGADQDTMALSCADLTTRNTNIAMRLQQIQTEQTRLSRQNAITDTVVGVGLGAVMGAGARGGLTGIRTASSAVQGIDTVRQAERGQGSMANVSDTLALMQRSAQLQRAIVEKGC